MTRFYKVADHVFSLTAPDSAPLWLETTNYIPFEITGGDDSVFSLTVSDSLPECDGTEIYDGSDSDEAMPRIRIAKHSGGYKVDMSINQHSPICGIASISDNFSEAFLKILDKRNVRSYKFAVDNALMLVYALRTAGNMTLEMHASVIEQDGKGYMFLGPSGTGKSTHSRLWLENIERSHLLNDDNPIVRITDGQAFVYGSPWSGKTHCYKNMKVQLKAIVNLSQAKHNTLTRLPLPEAYAAVCPSCSGMRADSTAADQLFNSIATLVETVPVYHLECLPDADAAFVCHDGIR